MPNFEGHEEAAARNQKVLDCLLENYDHSPDDFAHWVIAVAFYKALHLIEGVFSQEQQPFHSKDHQERNRRLKEVKKYGHLWRHYRPLFEASMVARYLVAPNSAEDQTDLSTYLSGTSIRSKFINHYLRQIEHAFATAKADAAKNRTAGQTGR